MLFLCPPALTGEQKETPPWAGRGNLFCLNDEEKKFSAFILGKWRHQPNKIAVQSPDEASVSMVQQSVKRLC
jgi:hypothetical protein